MPLTSRTALGAPRCSHLRALLLLSLVAGLDLLAEEKRAPRRLDDVRFAKTGFAWDRTGRAVTIGWETGDLSLWNARGEREKTCKIDGTQSAELLVGRPGLNDDRVLFAAPRGDHSTLNIFDTGRCMVVEHRDVDGVAVMGVYPSKNGWLLQVMGLDDRRFSMTEVDRSGRTTASWEIPDEVMPLDSDPGSGATTLLGKSAFPLEVDGDVWLVPQAIYTFVRPQQRGKEEYEFRPPSCLGSKGRLLTAEESEQRASSLAERSKGTAAGPVFKALASATRRQSAVGAVYGAAASGSRAAVVIREPEGGCRLDVWDLTLEKLLLTERLGNACLKVPSLSDDTLSYLDDEGILKRRELPALKAIDAPCKTSDKPEQPGGDRREKEEARE